MECRKRCLAVITSPDGPASDEAARGRVFHTAVAEYIEHCRDTGQESDLAHAAQIVTGLPLMQADEVGALLDGWARSHVVEPDTVAGVEMSLTTDVGGYGITGRLDLVTKAAMAGNDDGHGAVIDHKTDWRVRSQAEIDSDFQGQVYALLASDAFGWRTVRVVFDFVRWGVTREHTYTEDDLAGIAERVAKAAAELHQAVRDELQQGDGAAFPARPGPWCGFCPLAVTCDVRAPEAISDQSSAEATAGVVLQLEEKLARHKAALKAFCVQEGHVDVGGVRFQFKASGGLIWPDAEAFVRAVGSKAAWDYIKVDGTKVRRALYKGELRAILVELATDGTQTKFGHAKFKPDRNGGEG